MVGSSSIVDKEITDKKGLTAVTCARWDGVVQGGGSLETVQRQLADSINICGMERMAGLSSNAGAV